MDDGNFLLAANSDWYEKCGSGSSDVWVFKCDSNGRILAETTFEGRGPEIAVTKNKQCAVVYNTVTFPEHRISVRGLDDKLNSIWKVEGLSQTARGTSAYKIAADGNDNFIVAGCEFGVPRLWKINSKGIQLWEHKVDTAFRVLGLDSLLVTESRYVISGPAQTRPDPNSQPATISRDDSDIVLALIDEQNP